MKPSFKPLAFALGAGLALAAPSAAHAQVSVGVQIGAPAWGPPVPQGTQYYYIPEIDGYYDIYNQVYVVFDGQQWVQTPYLDGYDPYNFHPYPVSYVGAQPWLYINTYRRYYPQYVAGWHRGGWGGNGPYYGHEYGAGRVYGYGGRPGGYYGNGYATRPGGYYGNGGYGRPGGYANEGFGRPGYHDFGGERHGGQPGFNTPGPGGIGGGRPGGLPGGGQLSGASPLGQPQRGGFQGGIGGGRPGGGQPGGGQPGGPGSFGGGDNRGGQPGGGDHGWGGGRRGGR